MNELKSLKQKVEKVLEECPETRNSDIELMIQIWQKYYEVGNSINLRSLFSLPREDHIKRVRASFNAKGKYLPTDLKIAKTRGILENEWRQAMGYPMTTETNYPTHSESYAEKITYNTEYQHPLNMNTLF